MGSLVTNACMHLSSQVADQAQMLSAGGKKISSTATVVKSTKRAPSSRHSKKSKISACELEYGFSQAVMASCMPEFKAKSKSFALSSVVTDVDAINNMRPMSSRFTTSSQYLGGSVALFAKSP